MSEDEPSYFEFKFKTTFRCCYVGKYSFIEDGKEFFKHAYTQRVTGLFVSEFPAILTDMKWPEDKTQFLLHRNESEGKRSYQLIAKLTQDTKVETLSSDTFDVDHLAEAIFPYFNSEKPKYTKEQLIDLLEVDDKLIRLFPKDSKDSGGKVYTIGSDDQKYSVGLSEAVGALAEEGYPFTKDAGMSAWALFEEKAKNQKYHIAVDEKLRPKQPPKGKEDPLWEIDYPKDESGGGLWKRASDRLEKYKENSKNWKDGDKNWRESFAMEAGPIFRPRVGQLSFNEPKGGAPGVSKDNRRAFLRYWYDFVGFCATTPPYGPQALGQNSSADRVEGSFALRVLQASDVTFRQGLPEPDKQTFSWLVGQFLERSKGARGDDDYKRPDPQKLHKQVEAAKNNVLAAWEPTESADEVNFVEVLATEIYGKETEEFKAISWLFADVVTLENNFEKGDLVDLKVLDSIMINEQFCRVLFSYTWARLLWYLRPPKPLSKLVFETFYKRIEDLIGPPRDEVLEEMSRTMANACADSMVGKYWANITKAVLEAKSDDKTCSLSGIHNFYQSFQIPHDPKSKDIIVQFMRNGKELAESIKKQIKKDAESVMQYGGQYETVGDEVSEGSINPPRLNTTAEAMPLTVPMPSLSAGEDDLELDMDLSGFAVCVRSNNPKVGVRNDEAEWRCVNYGHAVYLKKVSDGYGATEYSQLAEGYALAPAQPANAYSLEQSILSYEGEPLSTMSVFDSVGITSKLAEKFEKVVSSVGSEDGARSFVASARPYCNADGKPGAYANFFPLKYGPEEHHYEFCFIPIEQTGLLPPAFMEVQKIGDVYSLKFKEESLSTGFSEAINNRKNSTNRNNSRRGVAAGLTSFVRSQTLPYRRSVPVGAPRLMSLEGQKKLKSGALYYETENTPWRFTPPRVSGGTRLLATDYEALLQKEKKLKEKADSMVILLDESRKNEVFDLFFRPPAVSRKVWARHRNNKDVFESAAWLKDQLKRAAVELDTIDPQIYDDPMVQKVQVRVEAVESFSAAKASVESKDWFIDFLEFSIDGQNFYQGVTMKGLRFKQDTEGGQYGFRLMHIDHSGSETLGAGSNNLLKPGLYKLTIKSVVSEENQKLFRIQEFQDGKGVEVEVGSSVEVWIEVAPSAAEIRKWGGAAPVSHTNARELPTILGSKLIELSQVQKLDGLNARGRLEVSLKDEFLRPHRELSMLFSRCEIYIQPWAWAGYPRVMDLRYLRESGSSLHPDNDTLCYETLNFLPQVVDGQGVVHSHQVDLSASPKLVGAFELPDYSMRKEVDARIEKVELNFASIEKLLVDSEGKPRVGNVSLFKEEGEAEYFPRYYRVHVKFFNRYDRKGRALFSTVYNTGLNLPEEGVLGKKVLPVYDDWSRVVLLGNRKQLSANLGVPKVKMVLPLMHGVSGTNRGILVVLHETLKSAFQSLVMRVSAADKHRYVKAQPQIGPDPIVARGKLANWPESWTGEQSFTRGQGMGLTFERQLQSPYFPHAAFVFELGEDLFKVANPDDKEQCKKVEVAPADVLAQLEFAWEMHEKSLASIEEAEGNDNDEDGGHLYSDWSDPWWAHFLAPFNKVRLNDEVIDFDADDQLCFKKGKDGSVKFSKTEKASNWGAVKPLPPVVEQGPEREEQDPPAHVLLFIVWAESTDTASSNLGRIVDDVYYIDSNGGTKRVSISPFAREKSSSGLKRYGQFLLLFGAADELPNASEMGRKDGISIDDLLFPGSADAPEDDLQDARARVIRCSSRLVEGR